MEKLEELPENWCIKIKKENIDLYKNTTKLGFGINNNYIIGGYYGPKQDEKGWKASISPRNRTLITDEDFKRLVLKEKKEKYFLCDEEISNLIKENTAPKKEKIYLTILETPNPGNNILGASFQVEEVSKKVYKSGDIIFDFNTNYKAISYHISKTYEEECLFLDKIRTFKKNLSQYKLGTEFNVAHLKNQKCIIESNYFKIDSGLKMIWNYSKDKSLFNDFFRCVFYFGKWGEILESKPEISKIDKLYLSSACCKTLNPIIINYFKKKFPSCHTVLLKNHTGISWNSNGFWYVVDVNKCKSPVITEKDFLLLLEQQGELKNPYPEDINPCKEVYGTKIHEEFFKINDKKEVLYNPKSELIYEKEQNNLKNNTLEINENELILEIESFPELEFINITRI